MSLESDANVKAEEVMAVANEQAVRAYTETTAEAAD